MANLRTPIDATFWDLNVSSNRTLDGVARSIPGEPFPLDGARASRALRIQQLSILGCGFPLGIIPSFSPPSSKELGPLALQSLFLKVTTSKWWVGLVGQVRPKKLISNLKAEINSIKKEISARQAKDEWDFWDLEWEDMSILKDLPKAFLVKSFYSLGVSSQIALTDSSSLLLSTEKSGEEERRRVKAMYMHQFPEHDVTLEAAWPERFIDCKGKYWEVPESVSLDCSSLISESGLRYRFGIHKNSGQPLAVDNADDVVPPGLLPGICAKVACSYEKAKDIWRVKEREEDVSIKTDKGLLFRPAYDLRLKEPHSKISGVIGGTCAVWFGGGNNSTRSPLGADLFGSVCYTYQHGKFREAFKDLTRIDARLDISSAAALAKRVTELFTRASNNNARDASPRLSLILQQQVAGPIVFRIDSRFSINSWYVVPYPRLEDYVFSLNYSLRLLRSGKVVAWYSPKRKEAMVELRIFEF